MSSTGALLKFEEFDNAADLSAVESPAERYKALKSATAEQPVYQDRKSIFAASAGSLDLTMQLATELAAAVGGTVYAVGIKDNETAARKIDSEYGGVCKFLCDGVRAAVIIPADNVELTRAVVALHNSTRAVKDLIEENSKTGLAILNTKAELPNGLIAEIQYRTPNMHEAMQLTHDKYKKIADLTNRFAAVALPPEVANEIKRLKTDCVDIHTTGAALDRLDRYVDKKAVRAHGSPALVT